MSYNLKNRAVAVIALAFMFTLALNHASFAAEENSAATAENTVSAPVPTNSVDALIQPAASAADEVLTAADNAADAVADKTQEAADAVIEAGNQTAEAVADAGDKAADAVADTAQKTVDSVKSAADELQNMIAETPAAAETVATEVAVVEETAPLHPAGENDLDFLDEQIPEEFLNNPNTVTAADTPAEGETANTDVAAPNSADMPADGEIGDLPNDLPNDLASENFDELKDLEAALPEVDAPKSPLERFGNAILSKVDNNLFNQMSHIEKEATLLQLEKKREELRTKVLEERQKSLAIIEATRRAKMQLEEERKRAEAERQAKILEEERKLKEKEMELEKLRQGKVINDYMNEMLMMNQQWVEKSAKLQGRIKELEDERVDLINTFKTKIVTIDEEIQKTQKHAALAAEEHKKVVDDFNEKIAELESTITALNRSLRDSQRKIKEIQEAAANPFKEGDEDGENADSPNKNDVDMSKEYAILDITGKGDDIVAKIVNANGKIFIVHKGSMLKNGEVVTSITDHYISFENTRGTKSYLYTGGTVMEYEPEQSFGGSGEFLALEKDEETLDSVLEVEPEQEIAPKRNDNAKQTKPKKKNVSHSSSRILPKKQNKKSSSKKVKYSSSGPSVRPPSFGESMFAE